MSRGWIWWTDPIGRLRIDPASDGRVKSWRCLAGRTGWYRSVIRCFSNRSEVFVVDRSDWCIWSLSKWIPLDHRQWIWIVRCRSVWNFMNGLIRLIIDGLAHVDHVMMSLDDFSRMDHDDRVDESKMARFTDPWMDHFRHSLLDSCWSFHGWILLIRYGWIPLIIHGWIMLIIHWIDSCWSFLGMDHVDQTRMNSRWSLMDRLCWSFRGGSCWSIHGWLFLIIHGLIILIIHWWIMLINRGLILLISSRIDPVDQSRIDPVDHSRMHPVDHITDGSCRSIADWSCWSFTWWILFIIRGWILLMLSIFVFLQLQLADEGHAARGASVEPGEEAQPFDGSRDRHRRLPRDRHSRLPRDRHSRLPRDRHSRLLFNDSSSQSVARREVIGSGHQCRSSEPMSTEMRSVLRCPRSLDSTRLMPDGLCNIRMCCSNIWWRCYFGRYSNCFGCSSTICDSSLPESNFRWYWVEASRPDSNNILDRRRS